MFGKLIKKLLPINQLPLLLVAPPLQQQLQTSHLLFKKLSQGLQKLEQNLNLSSTPLTCSDAPKTVEQNIQEQMQKWIESQQKKTWMCGQQEREEKIKKLEQLLLMLISTGNIQMALMLFSQLDNLQCQEVSKALCTQLIDAQNSRKTLTSEMSQLQSQGQNGQNAQNNQGKLTEIQGKLQEVGDKIQMIQMMMKDLNDQKNRIIEFTNNLLNTENQTTLNIIRR